MVLLFPGIVLVWRNIPRGIILSSGSVTESNVKPHHTMNASQNVVKESKGRGLEVVDPERLRFLARFHVFSGAWKMSPINLR